jgi:glycerol-3-phosphate dehydrogenase (NAD(P)+)
MRDVLCDAESIIAVPSHVYRNVFTQMLPHIDEQMLFISATKGIENETLIYV